MMSLAVDPGANLNWKKLSLLALQEVIGTDEKAFEFAVNM
jgi:hypothetical protein